MNIDKVTMVQCLVFVSALLLASVWAPADCQLECPRSKLQIISRNTTLLSPSNITATRFYNDRPNYFPPSFFGNFTPAVWCAPQGSNPNVSLNFSQLVLITGFIPGGYSSNNGSNQEYVTNFALRYSENLDGNEFSNPQEFTISAGANLDQLVILENPFLALRLHVQVNSFVTVIGDICMGMAFYGCHHLEATQVQQTCGCPSVIPHPVSTSTVVIETCGGVESTPVLQTQVEICGGVESTPALQPPQSQVVRDYQALAIALPIALITILITVAIVGVGVALCIRGRVREKEPSPSCNWQPGEKYETIRAVENILYSTEKSPASLQNEQYEVVELAPSEDAAEHDSMVDNPRYGEIKH